MARRELTVTHFEADKVLVAAAHGRRPSAQNAREVLRVTIHGPNFPQRAVEPEILIGDVRAQNVSIARDQTSITGFFAEPPPDGAEIRVRYGDSQEGVLRERFSRAKVRPLAREC